MIKNFREHAANERTFLAWVRTGIAVMAFGFIVEKFDLFLAFTAPSIETHGLSLQGQRFGNIAGLALIFVGTAMVAMAAIRFFKIAKMIDDEQTHKADGAWTDITLAVLLVLLGSALFLYLARAFITN